jgi:hypothetical protein
VASTAATARWASSAPRSVTRSRRARVSAVSMSRRISDLASSFAQHPGSAGRRRFQPVHGTHHEVAGVHLVGEQLPGYDFGQARPQGIAVGRRHGERRAGRESSTTMVVTTMVVIASAHVQPP